MLRGVEHLELEGKPHLAEVNPRPRCIRRMYLRIFDISCGNCANQSDSLARIVNVGVVALMRRSMPTNRVV